MRILCLVMFGIALGLWLGPGQGTGAAFSELTRISKDPYKNTSSQHRTQVEPDTFAYGSTIVAAFQSGRFITGGASNIGWATSTNAGATWSRGFLPNTTVYAGGPFPRISDPAVAFDAKHDAWMIAALTIGNAGQSVVVSRSLNGGLAWQNPVTVSGPDSGYDKTWIACDNSPTSPFWGNCYAMWDDAGAGGTLKQSTSTDGGTSWSGTKTVGGTAGIGVQPLTQPDGTLVVPYYGFDGGMYAVRSTDGGNTWNSPQLITIVADHRVAAGLRSEPLPTADVDRAGKVYLIWQDCRFIKQCRANDLVMSTSNDGVTWSAVRRIPLDPKKSGVDHFIPGIGIDPNTSGDTAHLALSYYYFAQSACTSSTCKLKVGYATSTNGGATWTAPVQLAGPMRVTWLADTSLGYMVGDYISTSIVNGNAFPVFPVARAPLTGLRESMFAPTNGLPILTGTHAATTPPLETEPSTQPPRKVHTLP